jgi:hypothetical protein
MEMLCGDNLDNDGGKLFTKKAVVTSLANGKI